MGHTIWHLGFDKNKKLHRLPSTIFKEKETNFNNQTIKVIELVMYLENRKPVKIVNKYYYKLKFKDNGKLDKQHYEKGNHLQQLSINFFGDNLTQENILSKKKYNLYYSWTPSNKEINLINKYLNKKGLPLNELL